MKRKAGEDKGGSFSRNFQHVDGNWPSYVYITGQYKKLDRIANDAIERFSRTYLFSSLCDCGPDGQDGQDGQDDGVILMPEASPHISLSRPFVLRKHQIGKCLSLFSLPIVIQLRSTTFL